MERMWQGRSAGRTMHFQLNSPPMDMGMPRPPGASPVRRAWVVAVLLALLASLALVLWGDADSAQAQQEPRVQAFVSNIGHSRDAAISLEDRDISQSFTSGPNADGYDLVSVELSLEVGDVAGSSTTPPPSVVLYRGPEGTKVADLAGPAVLSANSTANYTFSPTTRVLLEDLTTYWLQVEKATSQSVSWTATDSGDEVSSEPLGWTIEDHSLTRGALSTGGTGQRQTHSFRFRINGTAGASPVLVRNTRQSWDTAIPLGDGLWQAFTTGSNAAGYTLDGIELVLKTTADVVSPPEVGLELSGDREVIPVELLGPVRLEANTTRKYRFAPRHPISLLPDHMYSVIVDNGSDNVQWMSTHSDLEDPGGAAGWSMEDSGKRPRGGSVTDLRSLPGDQVLLLRVDGESYPPTMVSNRGQAPAEPYAFTEYKFGQRFTTGNNPGGYRLAAIEIDIETESDAAVFPWTMLRQLLPGSTSAVAGYFLAPATAREGVLVYTPAAPIFLEPSTRFIFITDIWEGQGKWVTTASDSEDGTPNPGWEIEDYALALNVADPKTDMPFLPNAEALKITVKAFPVMDSSPTEGAPVITAPNVFRVPAVLGVDLSSIRDSNGLENIADSISYNWQRFAADGTTLESDGIGTGSTYTLTEADAAKRLKVAVNFLDDLGYRSGIITSEATGAIAAEAECSEPTLVGGATFIGPARKLAVQKIEAIGEPYGYNDLYDPSGTLDSRRFTTAAGNSYVIKTLVRSEPFSRQVLSLSLDKKLADVDKNRLVLHVCDRGFPVGPVTPTGSAYIFSSTDMDWSSHAERTIYLSEDAAAPTFVDASVDGTSLEIKFSENLATAASLANSAFTVTKGSPAETVTLSGSPSISSRTVTLTLATAVSGTDTDLKVSYSRPNSGTGNKLMDGFDNEVTSFADAPVDIKPPAPNATVSPALGEDGLTLTLTFDEALRAAAVPGKSAFTVKATPLGGVEATVSLADTDPVSVSGRTVVLTLATPVAHNDSDLKVSYEKPGTGGVIEDANGNDAASFSDLAVVNSSSVPRVSIRAVHDDATPGIAHAEFKVVRSNTGTEDLAVNFTITQDDSYLDKETIEKTINIPAGQTEATRKFLVSYSDDGMVVSAGSLTLDVVGGDGYLLAPQQDSATVQVKLPTSSTDPVALLELRDSALSVVEGQKVELGVVATVYPGVAQPREDFTFAVLTEDDGTAKINLDYQHVSLNVPVAAEGWTQQGDGSYTQALNREIQTWDDVNYELAETFTAYIRSTQGVSAGIQFPEGQARNATVSITNDGDTLGVLKIGVTSTANGGYYVAGDVIELTVTISGLVEVTGSPQLALDVGGETRQATYRNGSASVNKEDSTELVFAYTVAAGDEDSDGISWATDALTLNGGTINFKHSDPVEQVPAALTHPAQGALADHKVDAVTTVSASPQTLVSNVGQDNADTGAFLTLDFAQDFTTGNLKAGYKLTSLEIQLVTTADGTTPPRLTLHSGSGTGLEIAELDGPESLDADMTKTYTYAPQGVVRLAPSTTYWIVADATGNGRNGASVQFTDSDEEDQTPLDGASIGDAVHTRTDGDTGSFSPRTDGEALKIRVQAVARNTPATGAPVITAPNAFRVPATLGVDLSGIEDTDGVGGIAQSISYKWQRYDAGGRNLEADSIGAGPIYTLSDADAGKKLKVEVLFSDDAGYRNGPLTSRATNVITAAAECPEPTLVGGATFIGPARKLAVQNIDNGSAYGYNDLYDPSGTLDSRRFTTASGNSYLIKALVHAAPLSNPVLSLSLDKELAAVDKSGLVLHVCDQAFPIGPVTPIGNAYAFSITGMDWAEHAERTIHLSQDLVEPTLVEAWVSGSSLALVFNEELGSAESLVNSSFTLKQRGQSGTLTLRGSPSISGNAVTFTLTTAIAATATDLKVSYSRPESGTNNRVVDKFGNEAQSFADEDVFNRLGKFGALELDTDVPAAMSEDGLTLTLTFDEALRAMAVPGKSAFTVKATPLGGVEATVSLADTDPVSVSGRTVVLTLATPVAHNDSHLKVSYDKPGTGGVIEDANGNDAASFSDLAVLNNSSVPRVSIRAVHDDATPGIAHAEFKVLRSNTGTEDLTVDFTITQDDSYLDLDSTVLTFNIPAGQTEATRKFLVFYKNEGVVLSGGNLTFELAGGDGYLLAPQQDSATVQVKLPTSSTNPVAQLVLRDSALSVVEGQKVELGVVATVYPGVAQPREDFAFSVLTEDDGTAKINLDYEHVSMSVPVAAGGWTQQGDGSYTQSLNREIQTRDDVNYELAETFTAYIESSEEVSSGIKFPEGQARNATVTVTNDGDTLGVLKIVVTSTANGGYYVAGDVIEFTVTISGLVEVTGSPQLAFDVGDETWQATYRGGSASANAEDSTELVFAYTVVAGDEDADGISWAADALTQNGGTINFKHSDPVEQVPAALAHPAQGALPDHKVDSSPPTVREAWVIGTSLQIAFSEELGQANSLENDAFTVTKGSNDDEQSLTGTPVISRNAVKLTVGTAVAETDTNVKVSYAKPISGSDNRLVDTSGNEAENFTGQAVNNFTGDTDKPELATMNPLVLAGNGRELTLTFNETLRASSIPAASAFTVQATPDGGSEYTASLVDSEAVTVSGETVVLQLASPIAHNDTDLKVSYRKPVSGTVIKDMAGNELDSLLDKEVVNSSLVPRVSIHSQHADATPGIADATFRVERSNTSDSDLEVIVNFSQTDTYLGYDTATYTIPANNTFSSGRLPSYYTGNTSGALTATVPGQDGLVPAVGGRNSADVDMKVPASGRTLAISIEQGTYTVTEGNDLTLAVTFTTGAGVARPRETLEAVLNTSDITATGGPPGGDFETVDRRVLQVLPQGWTASGTAFIATKTATFVINDDNEYEGSEQFYVLLKRDEALPEFFNPVCPQPADNGLTCRATITIEDDDTLEVSSVSVNSTASGGYYGPNDTITFAVGFNGEVAVTGAPQFVFELAGQPRQADYASGSGSDQLLFSYAVTAGDGEDRDGISWGADALGLNQGTIKYSTTNENQRVNAGLEHPSQDALPDHRVDTITPSLRLAEVDESMLSLFYSEELNSTAPASTAFTVQVDGGTGANPAAVFIEGSVVKLTLATPVLHDQAVTVSYAIPNSDPIRDLSGKEAEGFTGQVAEPASGLYGFRGTPGNRQVMLEWDDTDDDTIVRYQYRYQNASDTAWNPDWTNIPGSDANTTAFTLTGLTNGIEYTFEVRAVYLEDAVEKNGREGTVKSTPRGALVRPGSLLASQAGVGELALTWDDPNDSTITGYQYRYRPSTETRWNPDWTDIEMSGATTASHKLSGLSGDVSYTVEVRALRDGEPGPEASLEGTPLADLTRPRAVRDLRAIDYESGLLLQWRWPEKSGDSAISHYEVRYALGNAVPADDPWQLLAEHPDTLGDVPTDTGVLYTFEVRAVNVSNKAGPVAQMQATPEYPPQFTLADPPESLDGVAGETYREYVRINGYPTRRPFVDVTLKWKAPEDEGNRAITDYMYRYVQGESVPESTPWSGFVHEVNESPINELKGTVRALDPGTLYAFEVATVTSAGVSAPSATFQLTTTSYTGPDVTMSVGDTAKEGQPATITAERTVGTEGNTEVILEIQDTGRQGVIHIVAIFGPGETLTTTTYTPPDDNVSTTNRKFTIRIGDVGRSGEYDGLNDTFHTTIFTVDVTDKEG